MRDLKRRKNSVASIQQITKAMKLVATVKLQKAREKAESIYPYTNHMYQTMSSILAQSGDGIHPYLMTNGSTQKAVIVITSNRGLAGGYHSNVVKLIRERDFEKSDTSIYAIGSKGCDVLARRGYRIIDDASEIMDGPSYTDAMNICRKVLEVFSRGEVGEIYLAYTHFKNTVTHIPTLTKLLPIDVGKMEERDESSGVMSFEPSTEEVLEIITFQYLAAMIYGALVESIASENGARMQAMDSATGNADELIDDLTLQYNRARQGSITQELTEIVAGAIQH